MAHIRPIVRADKRCWAGSAYDVLDEPVEEPVRTSGLEQRVEAGSRRLGTWRALVSIGTVRDGKGAV